MNLRRALIDWPAKLFNLWWAAYAVLIVGLFMVLATVMVIALVLDQVFGIRWGW